MDLLISILIIYLVIKLTVFLVKLFFSALTGVLFLIVCFIFFSLIMSFLSPLFIWLL